MRAKRKTFDRCPASSADMESAIRADVSTKTYADPYKVSDFEHGWGTWQADYTTGSC